VTALTRFCGGWSAYFSYGSRATAYREVNNYVSDRVRHFLKRRQKVQSRGAEYYGKRVFGELKVVRLCPPSRTA
jgi:RNA-directed DNA polymerase